MYRYNPYLSDAIKRAKDGELGKIISVEAQMNCYHQEPLRSWLGNYPGGMTFFLGCHLVDLIVAIMGEPTRIVPLNKCTGLTGDRENDYGFAAFEVTP